MPELPEVQTTVNGLKNHIIGLRIRDIWSNYRSDYYKGSKTIKDPVYFAYFKKEIAGKKIVSIDRRAKNILIGLEKGSTILVHLKMTGHLLLGRYSFNSKNKKDPWEPMEPEALKDPYNRHIRLAFSLSNDRHLALSDVRRFAKVALIPTDLAHDSSHLSGIGPEPLEKSFTLNRFVERLMIHPAGKIKQVLIDQTIVAGIGNIYADESLWRAGLNPAEQVRNLGGHDIKRLYAAVQSTLKNGIDFGGDSMSDYRNVHGEKGAFQEHHCAYRRTSERCMRKGCKGIIARTVIGGRSTHYCPFHQKMRGSIIKHPKKGYPRSH